MSDYPRAPHLETHLGFHLKRTGSLSNSLYMRAAADCGVISSQFGALEIISDNPGISQQAVGNLLGLDKSSISPAITRLAKNKLVRREPGSYKRSYCLYITEEGENLLAQLRQRAKTHEKFLAKALTPQERDTLIALLDRLFDHMMKG